MKKKIVEVDEDVLKEIIVGDIPVFGKDSPARKKSPWNIRKRKAPPQPYRQILQRKSPPWRSPKGKRMNPSDTGKGFWSIYPRQTVPMCISTVKWPSASNGYCLSSLRR